MVYTELAPRRQQFHVATAMYQPNSATTSVDIKNTCYKKIQPLLQNHMQHERTQSREWRYIKAINNNNNIELTAQQALCFGPDSLEILAPQQSACRH